ncbi:colorectal cancer associated 2 isoform X2 [Archocentrus centrarchus]|uniref:colorectal cancer associated 2 isoform X2 n=1 Tax=Archocentrus centrarchus TaxID=63155 RepID=UPI0011EA4C22|nr:colorectal cancer-associated protein 2 isoform X2 [Archocentrus centrarchus]
MVLFASKGVYCACVTPCSLHSDKLKVYQGVRVKTTVKELLQRHREREANTKKLNAIHQACLELQELPAATFPSRHVAPPPAIHPSEDNSCGVLALQLRTTMSFPLPDSACNIQTQESVYNSIQVQQQQFGDVMLPSNGYSGTAYDTPLPPLPTSPQPWRHGLSSDVDYYGQGIAPCSSLESLTFCNPMDPNSYSPQDSFSSSSSSCYNSPTRMEASYHGLSPEQYHYQHSAPQDYYALSHCWSAQQESSPTPEYAPYFPPTDYPHACPVEDNCFRKDFPLNYDVCYSAL